ncbi:MAG: ABC transporter ATP-binding protein [Gemmatimonadales bacterium]|nr:ABC transporter ATP-binding protein [Gemmatimonadales bacterium]
MTSPITPSRDPRGATAFVITRALTKSYPVQRSWREILQHPFSEQWTPALEGVDLVVERGEFFGLLGPNGAGKTTLFKLLSTLVTPDSGEAWVDGLDVVRDAARLRKIVSPVIPDERSLLWRLSARENLRVFAALQGYGGEARAARITELLEIVGLDEAGAKMVGQFSSGMKQRLLIARALLPRPRLLLLDEPTRSLDPVSAQRFRAFLREEIADAQGCTVLLATHNAEEALELCTRVAVLDRGRVRAVGTPEELALRVAEERFRIHTRTPDAAAFGEMVAQGLVRRLSVQEADGGGWASVDVEIPGGDDGCAAVLAFLGRHEVAVARLERFRPSLAQVIEHVVTQHPSTS